MATIPVKYCSHCDDPNPENYRYCGNCGYTFPPPVQGVPLVSYVMPPTAAPSVISAAVSNELTEQDRAAILDKRIPKYVSQGFYVSARTPTTAQLVKPKRLSCFWVLFWLLFTPITLGLTFILYLLYYLTKKDEMVYLTVDTQGVVHTKRG
jgi:hypothetical protein